MTLQVLHQVGHNSNWNIDSFQDDGCGDGLVLSPLHQNMGAVEKLSPTTRSASIFDPQFYLPSSRKPKLNSYPFFPEAVDGGFQTSTFAAHSSRVAEACVEFQRAQGFRIVVIPTRFISEMYTDFVDRQRRFTIDAFMEAAGDEPVCLSVAITAAMIGDEGFRGRLLNWITSYPNVEEIYLMYQHPRDTKQVQDAEFLRSCISFFNEIIATGLRLVVGYTNIEGLLFASGANLSITMGAFENTRIFSIDKFLESEGERRGPKARIYLPGLLNWLQLQDAKTIRSRAPDLWDKIYEPTSWADKVLELSVEPTFNQPQLYRHFFANMSSHVEKIKPMSLVERRLDFVSRLSQAWKFYSELSSRGIELEKHGKGGHIAHWINALK